MSTRLEPSSMRLLLARAVWTSSESTSQQQALTARRLLLAACSLN